MIDETIKEMIEIMKLWETDIMSCKLTDKQLTTFHKSTTGLLGILGRHHPRINPDNDEGLANFIIIKKLEQVDIDGVVKLVNKKLINIDQQQIIRLVSLNNKLKPLYDIKL